MQRIMSGLYKRLMQFLKILIMIILVVLVGVCFFSIVSRYLFHFSITWAEELSRFLFIWLSLLGIVLVNDKDEHMKFSLITEIVPQKVSKMISLIASTIILVIIILLVIGGTTVTLQNLDWLSSALEIPYAVVYVSVPICGAILVIQMISRIYRVIISIRSDK